MSDMHQDIKRYYEKWWENPKDPRDFIFKTLNRLVLKRLPHGNGKKALDIGSGKGTIVSFLLKKGYHVTAVELNENFAAALRHNFPEIQVIEGDVCSIKINGKFDIITAIELTQNLDKDLLSRLLKKLGALSDQIMLNVSNSNSLHGFWTAFRRFQLSFVYTYSPSEIEAILNNNDFRITYQKGIGLLTPITLLSNFRYKLIPIWLAKLVNRLGDKIFPRICHLYYLEAQKSPGGDKIL